MKTANLNEYFLWNGQIVQCTSINPGKKSIGFNVKRSVTCPHCDSTHEIDDHYDIIESSPLFQENAEPIKTISE